MEVGAHRSPSGCMTRLLLIPYDEVPFVVGLSPVLDAILVGTGTGSSFPDPRIISFLAHYQ